MTFVAELNRKLTPRQLEIWERRSGLPAATEAAYIARWRGEKPPTAVAESAVESVVCPHLGEPTGAMVGCPTCRGTVRLKVRACAKHGTCLPWRAVAEHQFCGTCPDNPSNIARAERQRFRADGPKPEPALVPLPVRMVMPGDKRPHVWRGGVLQIWVTNACDRSCFGCTQCSNLAGKPRFMTPDQFRVAVESVADYFGVVGTFGGNPTMHPAFAELCETLRGRIPWEQRGLWSNHPKGKGDLCRITFNPRYSNLNVHESQAAWDEFARDWPECKPYLKGLDSDSRHTPPFVAMRDVVPDEAERWKLIQTCDINKSWSAMVCVFRGQLRGYFCELAASQAMLHQDESDYPDLGVPIVPGWWKQGQFAFAEQIKRHCMDCGIPLRGYGALANDENGTEQVSQTHSRAYTPKRPGRVVELVTELIQLGSPLRRVTDYVENGALK